MKEPQSRQPSMRAPAKPGIAPIVSKPLPRRRPARAKDTAPPDRAATPLAPGATEAGKGGNRRVRLTTESRDQLVERLKNPLVNLDEAAILLRVCRTTVRRYADAGLLPHIRTEGGQRRFYFKDIESFYLQYILKK